ncbi:MAG: phage tail assembly protein [Pseudomonadota bacterium]
MSDKVVEHTLCEPFRGTGDREISTVRMRRIKAKDMRAMSEASDDEMAQALWLIGRLSGLSPDEVDEMDAADVAALTDIIEGFQKPAAPRKPTD